MKQLLRMLLLLLNYRRIQPENRVDLGTSGIEIRNRLG